MYNNHTAIYQIWCKVKFHIADLKTIENQQKIKHEKLSNELLSPRLLAVSIKGLEEYLIKVAFVINMSRVDFFKGSQMFR